MMCVIGCFYRHSESRLRSSSYLLQRGVLHGGRALSERGGRVRPGGGGRLLLVCADLHMCLWGFKRLVIKWQSSSINVTIPKQFQLNPLHSFNKFLMYQCVILKEKTFYIMWGMSWIRHLSNDTGGVYGNFLQLIMCFSSKQELRWQINQQK